MSLNTVSKRFYNAMAFRLNRLTRAMHLRFTIRLNNKTFVIPVFDTLGEVNVHLKEDWFFHLVKSLKLPAGTDIVDIGLNVGQSMLAFRSLYDNPYWGFEPNPICVFYLEKLKEANQLQNVHILPVGLYSESTVVKLYINSEHDTAATIRSDLKPGLFQPQNTKYIPVFSLEKLALGMKKIGLIKIDVEGAELDVIAGMQETIRQHQPLIICEILDYTATDSQEKEQQRATELVNTIKGLGYRMFRIKHRSDMDLTYEELSTLELKKWTPDSLYSNDYLFLPPNRTLPA
jgi:FkbM family methyltransferase